MPALIRSDVWRDGGSISATVSDSGREKSFWLQTNRWDLPGDAGYEYLFVSDGGDPEAMQCRIEISSVEEREWLEYLLGVDDTGAGPETKHTFKQLMQVLKARSGL